RTVFETAGGEPLQRVLPYAGRRLPVVDLQRLSDDEQEMIVKRLLAEEGSRGFNLERGPLMRERLLRQAEHRQVLAVTLHHIVSDGWSSGLLYKELSSLYGWWRA